MRKIYLHIAALILFTSCMPTALYSQDIHFSQFQETPLYFGPGLIGMSKGYLRVSGNFRNQWSAFGNPYQTFGLSADAPVVGNIRKSRSYLGAGLDIYQDKSGASSLSKLLIGGGASGALVMGQSRLSLGIHVSYNQRSMQTGGLTWDSQYVNGAYNPSAGSGEGGGASTAFWDYDAGLAYYLEKSATNMSSNDHFDLLISAACFHFLQPNQGLFGGEPLKRRYVGMLQSRVGIRSTNLSLMPKVLFQSQSSLMELNFGCIFQYVLRQGSNITGYNSEMGLGLGASYRMGDAVIPEFMYYYGGWSVGVSYDITVSGLTPWSYGRGGFEITLKYIDLEGKLFGKEGANRTLF